MSQGNGGGDDAAGVIFMVLVFGALIFFYRYVIFFFWIPTKMLEMYVWSLFHPHYVVNLQKFVNHITIPKLTFKEANYVNIQFLNIGAHGWFKPVALIQSALSIILAVLVWFKVRQHGMRPISSISELVSVQKAQFPWGWFWLKTPQTRTTAKRPHEVFGKTPVFNEYFPVLKKQLGRRDISFSQLPNKSQALYTAFVMQVNGDVDGAQAVLKALALGNIPKKMSTDKAEKDWRERNARFHFERSCFADVLFQARSQNLLPSSWFNWLKIEDRGLWMTLNSTPPYRQTIKPFRSAAEAVGPLSWWIYVQYRPLNSNDNLDDILEIAFSSINTIQETLKEVNYAG